MIFGNGETSDQLLVETIKNKGRGGVYFCRTILKPEGRGYKMGRATREKDEKIIIHRSGIKVPYTWSAGAYASRFFTELRDNKKILGTKCPKCNRTYIPPRKNCPKCFVNITKWVELGNTGTLLTYTIVRYEEPLIQPMEPPYAYGIIKLDGADTGLTHLLGEVDLNKIKPGMRVQAVFREEREGNMLDIKYFKPLE